MAAPPPPLSSSATNKTLSAPQTSTQQPSEGTQQQEQQPQTSLRSEQDATEESNPATAEEQEQPRPPFAPFFTLVEDVNSSEHFHPTVHYIFSDDDTDLLTDAALRALSGSSSTSSSQVGVGSGNAGGDGESRELRRSRDDDDIEKDHRNTRRDDIQDSPTRSSHLKHQRGIRERYVVVDIGTSGDTVTSARSFNADWQALGAELTNAPTWDAEDVLKSDQQQQEKAGLMLRIEGVQSLEDHEEEDKNEVTPEMLERFEKRMVTLRKVVAGS
ncbi:MAG: hypothetical protein M1823_000181 [Watsoniomyces obsoletus]|nr:MAG: hypothetical protein M1823_000181 [Watsoniomyces obsoletus]